MRESLRRSRAGPAINLLVAGPTLAEANEFFRSAVKGQRRTAIEPPRRKDAKRRKGFPLHVVPPARKVVKVHAITRAYCPRMGRLVFRVRPLYRFVRERLTGLSKGGFTAQIEPQRHRDTERAQRFRRWMGLCAAGSVRVSI